jgi:hypothetical protein
MRNAFILCFVLLNVTAGCKTTNCPCRQEAKSIGVRLATVDVVSEARDKLTFGAQPIHPRLVQQLLGGLADAHPVTMAVDVAAAAKSGDFLDEDVKSEGRGIFYETGKDAEWQRFEYRKLGTLANGTVVILTLDSGGGSGIFENLLFLKFEVGAPGVGEKYPQLVMRSVGQFPLGDRDERAVKVRKNRVIVAASSLHPRQVLRCSER